MWIQYRYRLYIGFLLGFVLEYKFVSFAQIQETDSLIHLSEVEIIDFPIHLSEKVRKISVLDTVFIQSQPLSTLGDVLSQHSDIFIKSNGASNLSVPSLRGTSASHTPVVWDGINLQDPMNGQIDLNLLPVYFFDDVSLHYGGDGALFGDAVIGGMISLKTDVKRNNGIALNLCNSVGSFGKIHTGAGVHFSDTKSQINFKVLRQYSENNYPFFEKTSTETIKKTLTNARSDMKGALAEYGFFMNANNRLKFSYWNLQSQRQIPPASSIPFSDASQNDQISASKIEWKKKKNKNQLSVRSAWISTGIFYYDPSLEINSSNVTNGAILDSDFQSIFSSQHSLYTGISLSYTKAKTTNYNEDKYKKITSVFTSYTYSGLNGKLIGLSSLRVESYDFKKQQVLPSIGIKYKIFSSLNLSGNLAKHFRFPTFNDLYWYQGGNPLLEPESGWNKEVHVSFDKEFKKTDFEIKMNYFHNKIDNWIIWLPNGYFWYPMNLKHVIAQGFEIDFRAGFKITSLSSLNLNCKYSYTRSVNSTSLGPNDNSANKQLIYVPENRWVNDFIWNYKYFTLLLNTSFTGIRYTSSDNSEFLESFMLLNLRFMYTAKYRNFSTRFFAGINNVTNKQYSVISARPMALRNYELGVNMDLSFYKSK